MHIYIYAEFCYNNIMKKNYLDRKKEYGLIFSGGGTKGCYEIGVWKAIDELGVNILAVAGTSIGAINGAFFCNGDFKLAYDIWVNADKMRIFFHFLLKLFPEVLILHL